MRPCVRPVSTIRTHRSASAALRQRLIRQAPASATDIFVRPQACPLNLVVPLRFTSSGSPSRRNALDLSLASKLATPASTADLQRSPEVRQELQNYDREMSSGKRSPDLTLSKRFISVFGHLDGMLPVVLAHWNQAQERGLKADIDLQVLMMRICARTGEIEKANQFWQAMIRSGVTPPAKAFAVIMEVHGRVGDVRKAQQLFDLMQRRGVQPDILVYTVLMSCYARADSTDIVIEILDSMRADGVAATAQTFSALIAVAVQKRNRKLIDALLQHAEQQGLQLPVATIKNIESLSGKPLKQSETFSDRPTSLTTLAMRGAVRPAIDYIREQYEKHNVRPSTAELSAVMNSAIGQEMWMEAEWLCRFAVAEKLLPIDEAAFRDLLLPWTKKRDPTVAVLLIKSWLGSSPVVSSVSILEFLQVASRTRAFSGVFSAVSETMLSLFEGEALTSLYSLLTRSHLWKEAEAVLRKALEEGRRVELDPIIHLMKEAAKERDCAALLYWLKAAVKLGYPLPDAAVEVLLLELAKLEQYQPMQDALTWLKTTAWVPSADAYSLLMMHHLRSVDADGALKTYEAMLAKGVRPRSAIVDQLVTTLAMSGRLEEAEKHFWQREPSQQVVTLLLLAFAERGNLEAAERVWSRFTELIDRSETMEELYGAMITLYSRAGRDARANELQAELENKLQEEEDAHKLSTKAQSVPTPPTRNSFAAAEPEPV